MFFLKHATEFSFLISIGVLFHSLVAETAKERPPSVSLLYLGQTALVLEYLVLRECCLLFNQVKQKGGNLPAFHGAWFQQGYGLGSIFRGLFRWAVPHLQQGAKALGKKALQSGVNVAQDVLAKKT